MGAKHKTLLDLVHHQLKDLYFAERHAGKMLVKMAKVATNEPIRTLLEQRHDAHVGALERLDTVFDLIDRKAHGEPCEAMQGIIEETKTLIDDVEEGTVLDAALIAAAEAIEHYTIARYTALKRWSLDLDLGTAAAPIDASLAEAKLALERLATLAASLPPAPGVPTETPLTLKAAALMGIR